MNLPYTNLTVKTTNLKDAYGARRVLGTPATFRRIRHSDVHDWRCAKFGEAERSGNMPTWWIPDTHTSEKIARFSWLIAAALDQKILKALVAEYILLVSVLERSVLDSIIDFMLPGVDIGMVASDKTNLNVFILLELVGFFKLLYNWSTLFGRLFLLSRYYVLKNIC